MTSSLIMKNKPEGFDSDYAMFMHMMWHLAKEIRASVLTSLILRLKQWQVDVLERHVERPVGKFYADNCELCEGKGKMHVCIDPWCENGTTEKDQKFCPHPTPHELRELNEIHTDYLKLLDSVKDEFLAGRRPQKTDAFAKKHNHDDEVGPN